jgi:Na+-transporting methylmalonyl-CoA/oxaloacetate decarboxylase gamma subunit
MDQLELIFTGFGIVIGVLSGLWGACALVGQLFREKPSPVATPVPAAKPAKTEEGVPPHHVAAIAAAVAAVMSTPYRIINIDAPPLRADSWKVEGRFKIHRVHWGWHVTNLPRERK